MRRLDKKILSKKGFSLLEIIIVVAIIVILAGVLSVGIAGLINTANNANNAVTNSSASVSDLIESGESRLESCGFAN